MDHGDWRESDGRLEFEVPGRSRSTQSILVSFDLKMRSCANDKPVETFA